MTLSLEAIKELARETLRAERIDADVVAVTPREGADDSAEVILTIGDGRAEPVLIGVPRHVDRTALRQALTDAFRDAKIDRR